MSVAESIERIHALLALYRESHYDVEIPGGGTVTLRIGANAPPEVARWIGANQTATYLTACNPRSQSLSPKENEQRLDRLRQQVREHGGEYLEGAGHVPGENGASRACSSAASARWRSMRWSANTSRTPS